MLCVYMLHVGFGISGISLFGYVQVSSDKDVNAFELGSPFDHPIKDIITTYDHIVSYRVLNV